MDAAMSTNCIKGKEVKNGIPHITPMVAGYDCGFPGSRSYALKKERALQEESHSSALRMKSMPKLKC